MFTRKTAAIQTDESIAELKTIVLGGIKQWISIRGENIILPILLFLHCGPGTVQTGFMEEYQRELEKHFIVVYWYQRGAVLSYSKEISKESMTIG